MRNRSLGPFVLLASVLVLAACGHVRPSSTSGGTSGNPLAAAPLASRIVPASVLQTRLAAHQPTVLLFMATGCSSCVAEIEQLQRAIASHPGVQAVGVDIASGDTPEDLVSFLQSEGVADVPFLWVIDKDRSLVTRYQVAAMDSTVGIDGRGAIRFTNAGPADAAQLGEQLAALAKA